jgi:Rps23 Pro-64 3,4-dihydroxylase Tpa1-like proline 4-hydroxylase
MPENYEIAKISYDDEQIIDKNYRNNKRWLNFDKKLAETFFKKIKSYIPIEFEGNSVSCLNERLSFLKYSTGEYFRAHEDGYYIRPDNSEISYITVQIYLNDLKEEDGGATTFIKDTYNRIYQDYSIIPKVGRVLLFEHDIEHEGSILKNGLKYCIRTDVMYSVTKNNNEI